MKKITIALIVLIAIPILIISVNKITETTRMRKSVTEFIVTEKEYSPAHYTTTFISTGKALVPIHNYYPDRWNIDCVGVDEKGKERDFSFSLSQEEYNQVNIGDVLKKGYILKKGDVYKWT